MDPDLRVAADRAPYEAPTIARLGTLSELTLGGDTGPGDIVGGGAGDIGSLP